MLDIKMSSGLVLDTNAVSVLSTAIRNNSVDMSNVAGFVVVNDPDTHQSVCPVFKRAYSSLNPMVFDAYGNVVVEERSIDGIVDLRDDSFESAVMVMKDSPYSHVLGYVTVK